MKIKELIEIILKANYERIKLTINMDVSDKYKKMIMFEFGFIADALDFLDTERKFNYYNNMSLNEVKSYMDEYCKLGKKLNILQEKLKLNSVKYQSMKADIYGKKIINTVPNSAMDSISNFILLGLNSTIFNDLSSHLINTKLNNKFVVCNKEFTDVYCNFISFSDGVYRVKDGYKGFKSFIKEYDLLAKAYKAYGKEGIDRLSRINDLVYKNYKSFTKTNLIDSLFDYKDLVNYNNVSFENKKEDIVFQDIADKNGSFKEFDEEDIANTLLAFFKMNHTYTKIVSKDENEGFKDLSPLLDIIERRKKDLYGKEDIKNLIKDISRGIIKINFDDKENNSYKKLL